MISVLYSVSSDVIENEKLGVSDRWKRVVDQWRAFWKELRKSDRTKGLKFVGCSL